VYFIIFGLRSLFSEERTVFYKVICAINQSLPSTVTDIVTFTAAGQSRCLTTGLRTHDKTHVGVVSLM